MKIFIGLHEISGYFTRLQNGFEQLGVAADFVDFSNHPYYQKRQQNRLATFACYCIKMAKGNVANNKHLRYMWSALFLMCKILIFIKALFTYDVFIFSYGNSFFRSYDLSLLKLFKKKIIIVFNGSDSRPAYMDGCLVNQLQTPQKIIAFACHQKRTINRIEKFADHCICLPHSAHFLTKPFITWLGMGIPTPSIQSVIDSVKPIANKIKILHVFSDPARGTAKIREALNEVKDKGFVFDYVELTGVPHTTVLAEIQKCDFVIDGIYSDTPLGGFSTEAALLGKPALLAGYGWKEMQHMHEAIDLPPSFTCDPDELTSKLIYLIENKSLLVAMGQDAKSFVETKWSPKQVATRYLQLLDNSFPLTWKIDPNEINYLFGACLSKSKFRALLQQIIAWGGVASLQMQDKPKLEDLFLQLGQTEP